MGPRRCTCRLQVTSDKIKVTRDRRTRYKVQVYMYGPEKVHHEAITDHVAKRRAAMGRAARPSDLPAN